MSDTNGLRSVLRPGTLLDLGVDDAFFSLAAPIVDASPDEGGGVMLALAAPASGGQLLVRVEAIDAAIGDDDGYEFRCGALSLRTSNHPE
jgi:hypothetical protein